MAEKTMLVLATRNKGKSHEIQKYFEGFAIDICDLNDFGPIPPVVEDGETFEENAYKKARFVAKVLGFPALADDSGLEVAELGGKPGVHSARYAGPNATDAENNTKLLAALQGAANRKARFCCILSLAVPAGPALTYEGVCEGTILQAPRGTGGFGYDPLFYYPPIRKTFAEMTVEEKTSVSHRGKALQGLRDEFERVLIWLEQRRKEEEHRTGRGDICLR
jgi:XTP/dITP diphosphohydrolase